MCGSGVSALGRRSGVSALPLGPRARPSPTPSCVDRGVPAPSPSVLGGWAAWHRSGAEPARTPGGAARTARAQATKHAQRPALPTAMCVLSTERFTHFLNERQYLPHDARRFSSASRSLRVSARSSTSSSRAPHPDVRLAQPRRQLEKLQLAAHRCDTLRRSHRLRLLLEAPVRAADGTRELRAQPAGLDAHMSSVKAGRAHGVA